MSLGTKLAAAVAGLVALATLVTSAAGLVSTRKEVERDLDRFLQDRASEIVAGERAQPRDRDGRGRNGNDRNDRNENGSAENTQIDEDVSIEDAVERSTGPQAVDADAEVQILDEDGVTVASVGVTLPVDERDVSLAGRGGPDIIRTVSIEGSDYRILTRHIAGGGAIQIARSLGQTTDLLSGIQQQVLLIGLICSLLAAGAGLILARQATEPLRHLTASVEQVAETGDLSTTIELDRSDEIGRLADSFDTMLHALSESRRQQHRLVQDAAHELRTPLTSMKANVDLLAHAPDLDVATRNETVESIRTELTQLQLTFTEIIELATDSRQSVEHQPLDLGDVVGAAVRRFSARCDNPVEIQDDDPPSIVMANQAALERAMANLLGNAEKFSPPSSPIRVVIADGMVSVSDNGPGIAPGEEHRIFDRFYRSVTTQALPGSGLGLAIVDKIVSDHGGSVFARNDSDGGATVGFRLPVVGRA